MILLDATTRKLQIVLAGAKTTNDSPWVASYADIAQSGFAMSGANSATGVSNGVTAVDVVAAPAASTTRQLKYFSLQNADTVAITATVQYNDNATVRNMVTFILAVGQSLVYNAESGWVVQSYKAGQILGTATNDDAAAGNVGEYISQNVDRAAAAALTTAVAQNITSISLTPGDWNLTGTVATTETGAGTISTLQGAISLISATIPATFPTSGLSNLYNGATISGDLTLSLAGRLSLAATTTVYLVNKTFFTSTATGYGFIGARRAR